MKNLVKRLSQGVLHAIKNLVDQGKNRRALAKEFEVAEANCLNEIDVDYVPLNDVVREFSGFERAPTDEDFLKTIKFLRCFLPKHNVQRLDGHWKPIDLSLDAFLLMLEDHWRTNRYEEISYGIWFGREDDYFED